MQLVGLAGRAEQDIRLAGTLQHVVAAVAGRGQVDRNARLGVRHRRRELDVAVTLHDDVVRRALAQWAARRADARTVVVVVGDRVASLKARHVADENRVVADIDVIDAALVGA